MCFYTAGDPDALGLPTGISKTLLSFRCKKDTGNPTCRSVIYTPSYVSVNLPTAGPVNQWPSVQLTAFTSYGKN